MHSLDPRAVLQEVVRLRGVPRGAGGAPTCADGGDGVPVQEVQKGIPEGHGHVRGECRLRPWPPLCVPIHADAPYSPPLASPMATAAALSVPPPPPSLYHPCCHLRATAAAVSVPPPSPSPYHHGARLLSPFGVTELRAP